ncbi:MAG: DegT/DnrJ/EryC1/StrS family aminotransferase [Planctomycetota bacterium]
MAELHAVAARVLDSGRYVLGPELSAFEAECADYMGTPHALGVSSGTDALLVALMAGHPQLQRRRHRAQAHRPHQGDHARAPVRSVCRHGGDPDAGGGAGPAGGRGRCPGHRRRL